MAEESLKPHSADDGDYEEIAYEEVGRVCTALEELRDTVQSQNVRAYLDDAIHSVFYLVYEDDETDEEQTYLPFSDAA